MAQCLCVLFIVYIYICMFCVANYGRMRRGLCATKREVISRVSRRTGICTMGSVSVYSECGSPKIHSGLTARASSQRAGWMIESDTDLVVGPFLLLLILFHLSIRVTHTIQHIYSPIVDSVLWNRSRYCRRIAPVDTPQGLRQPKYICVMCRNPSVKSARIEDRNEKRGMVRNTHKTQSSAPPYTLTQRLKHTISRVIPQRINKVYWKFISRPNKGCYYVCVSVFVWIICVRLYCWVVNCVCCGVCACVVFAGDWKHETYINWGTGWKEIWLFMLSLLCCFLFVISTTLTEP